MAPAIKGLVLQEGDTVKYQGKMHFVKSFQLVTGEQPILTLQPISTDLIQVSLGELDDDEHDEQQQDGG